jgi:hypothetical protein
LQQLKSPSPISTGFLPDFFIRVKFESIFTISSVLSTAHPQSPLNFSDFGAAHTRVIPFLSDRNFTSIFLQPRAPRMHVFFCALFTLFRGSRPRDPRPRSRARYFSRFFWLPFYAQQLLAALLFFDFSLF